MLFNNICQFMTSANGFFKYYMALFLSLYHIYFIYTLFYSETVIMQQQHDILAYVLTFKQVQFYNWCFFIKGGMKKKKKKALVKKTF